MYIITFTRKMGTNGSEIAKRVASQLQYRLYDTVALENTAREMGFLEDVKEVDEKSLPFFQRLFSRQPEMHLDRLNSVIYELASRGNAVLLGRGSHILLKTLTCALHIRVIASLEKRVRNLMESGFQKDAAIKAIHKSDREREAFIKFAFGVQWDDPELYDMVLNMDNLSVAVAVDTVVRLARSEEIQARSLDATESLEMMGLARRAEAALIEAGFSPDALSISVQEPGRIRVNGIMLTESAKTKAEMVLRGVRGTEYVDNQVRIAAGLEWSPD